MKKGMMTLLGVLLKAIKLFINRDEASALE